MEGKEAVADVEVKVVLVVVWLRPDGEGLLGVEVEVGRLNLVLLA